MRVGKIPGKKSQRGLGVVFIGISAWFTWQQWHSAMTTGYFYAKASMLFPFFCFFGVGLALFPVDKNKLLEKYGVEKITSWHQLSMAWKVIVIVGGLCGLLNYLLLKGYIPWL